MDRKSPCQKGTDQKKQGSIARMCAAGMIHENTHALKPTDAPCLGDAFKVVDFAGLMPLPLMPLMLEVPC